MSRFDKTELCRQAEVSFKKPGTYLHFREEFYVSSSCLYVGLISGDISHVVSFLGAQSLFHHIALHPRRGSQHAHSYHA